MRGPIFKLLACLLVVGALTTSAADAAQRTGTKRSRVSRPAADKAYDLKDIMSEPKTYIQREVMFYCRFASTASLFKNINTVFNVNEHVNFAVWPDKAVLWDDTGRKDLLPSLYVAKNDPVNLEILRTLDKYELVAVTGFVSNVYAGIPWILVSKIERSEREADKVNPLVIEHMRNGSEALKAEAGGAAARHFEQALQYGLPPEFRAKAYEQIAQAYLLDNRLDKAREYLRQAVEAERSDAILHLALADTTLKMDDAAEAMAHAEFALENSGKFPQAYGILGESRAMMGDYVKAFQELNTAAGTPGITPREKAMIGIRRARIYVMSKRFADAARMYASLSEPGEPMAGEGWVHNEIGLFYERLYLETGDERYLDSSYAAYEEASRLTRLDASIIYNMAEIEFRRQRLSDNPDFTLVRELVGKINQIEPDYAPARIIEGRILFAEEKLEEAEEKYQVVANQLGDDPVGLMALAEAYIDLGRYMDAANVVKRARSRQPWHPRVKALGKFIEETAIAIATAESDTRFDNWLNPRQRGSEACPPGSTGSNVDARGVRRPSGDNQQYARGREQQRPAPSSDPRVAKGLARRPSADEYEEPSREYRREEPQRIARSRNDDRRDELYGAPSRTVKVRPGEGVRISSNGVARSDDRDYPQDIQASAQPAPNPNRQGGGYPVTEVRLPDSVRSEQGRNASKPLNLGFNPASEERQRSEDQLRPPENLDERNPVGEAPVESRREKAYEDESRRNLRPEPQYESRAEPPRYDSRYDRDAGYESRDARDRRDSRYESDYRDARDERYDRRDDRRAPAAEDRYGREDRYEPSRRDDRRGYADERRDDPRDYDRRDSRNDRDYDAEYDADGYLRFGQAPVSGNAYASLIVPEDSEPCQMDEGGVRIPKAFSFEPDTSPVIIARVRSPGVKRKEMPVRNANVYRSLAGAGRQPAEIIEKDPVATPKAGDTSVMVPPRSGVVQRTEVHLPSTTRGVGMTSDYAPSNR